MLVLIVDDNGRNRKLARDLLRDARIDTLEAATGGDALRLAVERAPDVILLDLRLPDIDGARAARMLATDPATGRIPVIAFSALPLDGSREWLAAAGFAGSIPKPIRVDGFVEAVRRYAERADDGHSPSYRASTPSDERPGR
jgi:two-component system, cell cycle response regulator DivK